VGFECGKTDYSKTMGEDGTLKWSKKEKGVRRASEKGETFLAANLGQVPRKKS